MAADKDQDKSGDIVWAVIGAALFGVPALLITSASSGWDRARVWLLEHDVLLPAASDPLLPVPGADGAGLDAARLAIGFGALAVVSLTLRLVSGLAHAGLARRRVPNPRER
ncbi:MAG: hypothetical protein ACRDP2_06220 [Nocardioidaceae bacterium]